MSGRRRTQMRRALSFFVSAFIGVLLLASPLAWGEGLLTKGEQSSVSTQQKAAADGEHNASGYDKDTNTSDAHVQENAPDGCEGVKASDTDNSTNTSDAHEGTKAPDDHEQNKTADTDKQGSDAPDSKTDAATTEAGQAKVPDAADTPASSSEGSLPGRRPPLGDYFYAPIKIGGKEISCSFHTVSGTPGVCSIGGRTREYGDLIPALAAKDRNAAGDLELPKTVRYKEAELKLVSITAEAFMGCPNITSTGLAGMDDITTLGDTAYSGCTSLKETGLAGSNITVVDNNTFQGCSSLTSTDLGNSHVTSVGDYAFQGCTPLASTGLSSSSVTSVGNYAFQGCTALLSAGLDNSSVTSVGNYAFQGCTSLGSTGLKNNDSVVSIGSGAFNECTSLTSTGLQGNKSVEKLVDNGYYSKGTFSGCTSLISTGLEGNTKISALPIYAFQGCTSLTSTGLGSTSVASIGRSAFQDCTSLTSTGLGSSAVASIGESAFSGCTSLTSAGLAGNDALSELGESAFQGCTALTATGLEGCHNVSSIARYCFSGCSSLGKEPDVTGATNTGDLVINQPRDGKQLKITDYAFDSTHFTRFYLFEEEHSEKPRIPALGYKFCDSVETIFVPSSWWGTTYFETEWMSGYLRRGFSISDGTLVIMSPAETMSAKRKEGTSDVATASIRVSSSFKGQITDSQGHVLKDFSAKLDSPNPTQVVDIDTDEGTGLVPSKEQLGVRPTEPGPYTYPSWAKVRSYNTETYNLDQTPFVCDLAATTYAIKFNGNGGTSRDAMYDLAMTYDVAKLLSANSYKRDKYQFDGWNTQADGSGEAYTDKQEVSNLTGVQGEKVILYAQWTRVVSMTLATNGRAGSGYVLSATEGDCEHGVDNVYTDSGKKNKASWPQMAPSSGTLWLYGLTPGTYYLYNTQAPAGYLLSSSHSFTINDKAEVVIDGQGEPKELTDDKIIVSFSFTLAPDLPQTGSSERGLLQGLGVLLALGITGVAVRALRHKIKG